MKKKHSILAASLLTVGLGIGAASCGDDGTPAPIPPTGGSTASGGMVATGGTPDMGGMPASGGTAGSGGVSGGGGSETGGTGGMGGTCDVPSLEVFPRSDSEDDWDDNDFSDVVLDTTACPRLATVTWPHEEGWENADPSEANEESVRFTIDSYYSLDLSGKQLNATIELTDDMRGEMAEAGGYMISLVSVSTWDRVVEPTTGGAGAGGGGGEVGGTAGADAGGNGGGGGELVAGGGSGGTSGAGGTAGAGGNGGGGTDGGGTAGSDSMTAGTAGTAGSDGAGGTGGVGGSGGTGGEAPMTVLAYSEAELPMAERAMLRYVGDRATVTFRLPSKTEMPDSFDPTRVVKINIRIYSAHHTATEMMGTGGMPGVGGTSGDAGAPGVGGAAGDTGAGEGGAPDAGGSPGEGGEGGSAGDMSGAAGDAGISGAGGTGGVAGGGGMGGTAGISGGGSAGGPAMPGPVYDYLLSQFAIHRFWVSDAGTQ